MKPSSSRSSSKEKKKKKKRRHRAHVASHRIDLWMQEGEEKRRNKRYYLARPLIAEEKRRSAAPPLLLGRLRGEDGGRPISLLLFTLLLRGGLRWLALATSLMPVKGGKGGGRESHHCPLSSPLLFLLRGGKERGKSTAKRYYPCRQRREERKKKKAKSVAIRLMYRGKGEKMERMPAPISASQRKGNGNFRAPPLFFTRGKKGKSPTLQQRGKMIRSSVFLAGEGERRVADISAPHVEGGGGEKK